MEPFLESLHLQRNPITASDTRGSSMGIGESVIKFQFRMIFKLDKPRVDELQTESDSLNRECTSH